MEAAWRIHAAEKAKYEEQLRVARDDAVLAAQTERALEHTRDQLARMADQLKDTRADVAAMHETNKVLGSAIDRADRLQSIRDAQEDGIQQSKFTVEEQLMKLKLEQSELQVA